MRRTWIVSTLAVGLLLTGCGQKPVEKRPAAECKPLAEYETYDTITVTSLDDVPQDCTSLLLTVSDPAQVTAYAYTDEDMLYYNYELEIQYNFPETDCFAYIVAVPEAESGQTLEAAAQRPLKRLGLEGYTMDSMDALSQMQGLETLWMSSCSVRTNFTGSFPALTDLWCNCCALGKFGDLEKVTTLQRLSLRNTDLKTVKGIENLTSLSKLDLSGTSLRKLAPLRTLTQLTALNLSEMSSFDHLVSPDIRLLEGMTNLKTLGLNGSRYGLKHTEYLQNLTALENLGAVNCGIDSLEPLLPLSEIRVLDLRANKIADLTPLTNMQKLETLKLHNNQLGSIGEVKDLPHLRTLWVGGNDIIDLSPMKGLTELEDVSVMLCANLTDIGPLRGKNSIRSLDIEGTDIKNTDTLATLKHLEQLEMAGTQISDLSFAEGLTNLKRLDIASTKTQDISPLLGLPSLESLDLSNTQIREITGIERLQKLRELKLSSTNVESIEELWKIRTLREVNLENCRKLEKEDIRRFKEDVEKRGGSCEISENW